MAKDGKHPGGRPERYTREFAVDLAGKILAWFDDERHFWLADFATENMMPKQALSELASKFPVEFSEAYRIAKQKQESRLVTLGLKNKHNAMLTGLALKNVADWRDRVETEHSGTIKTETKDVTELDRIKAEYEERAKLAIQRKR